MKELFSNIAILLALTIVFSSFSGCSNSGETGNGPVSAGQNTTASGNANRPKKSSDYPPIASSIAQADLKNLDGSTFKVADRQGKVLLLNMWATWCGPCRSEMPALVRMQEAHREQGFEVIGLNTDEEAVDDINKFAKSMNLNYQLVWAGTDLQRDLLKISQFGGIPQSFLIDRDGNLRGVFRGANPADIKKMEVLVAKVVNGEESGPPETNTATAPGEKPAASSAVNFNSK